MALSYLNALLPPVVSIPSRYTRIMELFMCLTNLHHLLSLWCMTSVTWNWLPLWCSHCGKVNNFRWLSQSKENRNRNDFTCNWLTWRYPLFIMAHYAEHNVSVCLDTEYMYVMIATQYDLSCVAPSPIITVVGLTLTSRYLSFQLISSMIRVKSAVLARLHWVLNFN